MDFDPLAHEFTSFVTESMYTYNILLNSADMHAISQVSVSASIWTLCSFYQQHLVGDCGVKQQHKFPAKLQINRKILSKWVPGEF